MALKQLRSTPTTRQRNSESSASWSRSQPLWDHKGFASNSVHPGAVITGMTDNQMTYDLMAGRPGGTRRHYLESGRRYGILKGSGFMDPITIAHAALFLNSDLASNVTGVQLPVDSGHLLIAGINTEPRS